MVEEVLVVVAGTVVVVVVSVTMVARGTWGSIPCRIDNRVDAKLGSFMGVEKTAAAARPDRICCGSAVMVTSCSRIGVNAAKPTIARAMRISPDSTADLGFRTFSAYWLGPGTAGIRLEAPGIPGG